MENKNIYNFSNYEINKNNLECSYFAENHQETHKFQ